MSHIIKTDPVTGDLSRKVVNRVAPICRAYIATKLENHQRHNQIRDLLAESGIGITYDWTVHGPVYKDGKERIREVAELEMKGVLEADFVIVILPGGRGTHAELGMALASNKEVLLLAETDETQRMRGAVSETCAFYHHPLCIWTYGPEHLMNYAASFKRVALAKAEDR